MMSGLVPCCLLHATSRVLHLLEQMHPFTQQSCGIKDQTCTIKQRRNCKSRISGVCAIKVWCPDANS